MFPEIAQVRVLREPTSGVRFAGDNPKRIYAFWQKYVVREKWYDANKEHVVVFALNTKFHLCGWNLVSIGSLNEAIAHPREVFRPLVALGAYGFVLAHNHPSGMAVGSARDKAFTAELREAAKIIGIKMVDFVIIGEGCYTSSEVGWRSQTVEKQDRDKAVQLQLATTLVEIVTAFEEAPDAAIHAEACRKVSKLHQLLHDPETFKRAAQG